MENPYSRDTDGNNLNQDILAVSILSIVLIVPVILVRLWVRIRVLPYFGIDDGFIIISGMLAIALVAYTIVSIQGGENGTGQHIDEVDKEEFRKFNVLIYIWELGYCTVICFIKFAILTYYNRLQPSLVYKITMLVCLAGSIGFIVTYLVQCWPIYRSWDPGFFPHSAHTSVCINDKIFSYCVAVFNIVTDFWIWGTCIWMLKGLQVAVKKKIEVITIFSIGLLACGASIARLETIYSFYATEDKTWAIVPILICSLLEVSLAIVAACLPTLKPGFVKVFEWVREQPGYIRATDFFARVCPLARRRRSGSVSSDPDPRGRSSLFSFRWKTDEPGHNDTRTKSINSTMNISDHTTGSQNGRVLSEIGRWGLDNNDFCHDLEMQHVLPTEPPERRPQRRSLSQQYLGNAALLGS